MVESSHRLIFAKTVIALALLAGCSSENAIAAPQNVEGLEAEYASFSPDRTALNNLNSQVYRACLKKARDATAREICGASEFSRYNQVL